MSTYMTEEEQLEAIRNWWKKYRQPITWALSVVLLITAGVRYWFWHQEKVTHQASSAYEQMLSANAAQDQKSLKAQATYVIQNYSKTVYADVARLALAKTLLNEQHMQDALVKLNEVIQTSKVPTLRDIARLRKARVQLAQKAYDDALNTLSNLKDSAYMPLAYELRGDIFAAKKQYADAMSSYRQAMTEVQRRGITNVFLDMKMHEIASRDQQSDPTSSPSKVV